MLGTAATAARLLLGAVGVLMARRLLPLWGADPGAGRVVAVARVLAARHLAQGAVVAVHPTRRTQVASAAVDVLHGVTMVVLAGVSRSYRRPAATSACIALTFAGLTGTEVLLRDLRGADPGPIHPGVHRVDSHRTPPAEADHTPAGSNGPAHPGDQQSPVQLLEQVAHEHATELTHRTERLEAAVTEAPVRSLSRAGAVVLLLLGVWLLVGQWLLSLPLTSAATTTGARDEGFAVLVLLAALRLLVHGGRSITASLVVLVCGALLVCSGQFIAHSAARGAANEVVCGAIALLCGVATLDRWRAGARTAQQYAVTPGSL